LPTGETLTSENAVDLLLNQVYLRYEDPLEQNLAFAQAAATVFDTLMSGGADPGALLTALGQAAGEARLLLWSAVEAERQIVAEPPLSGHRPVTGEDAARFAVYLHDGTCSKLGYYLDVEPQVRWDRCGEDQVTSEATLTLTMT